MPRVFSPGREGVPPKLRLGGSFDFFHHKHPVTVRADFHPHRRENVT